MMSKIKSQFEKIKKDHGLMMIICCLAPLMILFVALKFFNVNKNYIAWIILLLCPLMHFFMMKDMHKEHKTDDSTHNRDHNHDGKESKDGSDEKKGGGCH